MTSPCALCECESLDPGDVTSMLIDEFSPEDGYPDFVGLKRALEDEYSVELTVSGIKRHVDEHVRYQWGSNGVEVSGR